MTYPPTIPAPHHKEHALFIDSVLKFVKNEIIPHADSWEEQGFFPTDIFQKLAENGYLGLLIPESYGGVGGDYDLAAAWCEAFGTVPAVGFTVAVNMHSLVISHSLAVNGTQSAKKTWLPKAVSGEAIGAYAFTEPGAGSDLASITTRAVKDGESYIINGAKTFITNGKRADFVLVLTKTEPTLGYKGFSTFLVDTKTEGFSVTRTLDKLGWRSSDTAELSFVDVRVPKENLIGNLNEAWPMTMNNLNWERLMLVLTTLGGMRQCYQDTVRYAGDRKAFGKYLRELPSLSNYFSEMKRRIIRSEALTYRALRLLQSKEDAKTAIAMAKLIVCEDALWIADKCIQVHGGYGYTTEFSPERWWRDLRLMTIGGGTSEVMKVVLGKELVKA